MRFVSVPSDLIRLVDNHHVQILSTGQELGELPQDSCFTYPWLPNHEEGSIFRHNQIHQ